MNTIYLFDICWTILPLNYLSTLRNQHLSDNETNFPIVNNNY